LGNEKYKILVGSFKGRDYLGDLFVCGGGGNNIKIDSREMGYEGGDWIQLAQDTVQW
jgi:hypothetical protein